MYTFTWHMSGKKWLKLEPFATSYFQFKNICFDLFTETCKLKMRWQTAWALVNLSASLSKCSSKKNPSKIQMLPSDWSDSSLDQFFEGKLMN